MFTLQSKTEVEIVMEIQRLAYLDPAGDNIERKPDAAIAIELLPGGHMLDRNWHMVTDQTRPMAPLLNAAALDVQSRWRLATPWLGSSATPMH